MDYRLRLCILIRFTIHRYVCNVYVNSYVQNSLFLSLSVSESPGTINQGNCTCVCVRAVILTDVTWAFGAALFRITLIECFRCRQWNSEDMIWKEIVKQGNSSNSLYVTWTGIERELKYERRRDESHSSFFNIWINNNRILNYCFLV